MNKYLLIISVLIIQFSYCQEKDSSDLKKIEFIYHEVKNGETVAQLYKKYLVNPSEIYKANEGIYDGIVSGIILKIPITDEYRKKNEVKLIMKNENIAQNIN